jgi:hypothetical protein
MLEKQKKGMLICQLPLNYTHHTPTKNNSNNFPELLHAQSKK